MGTEMFFLLTGATFLCVAGIAFAATMWLRKLREVFSLSLSEMAGHQVRAVQRLSESIAQLQKQQDLATKQIRALAQEGIRLQKEISMLARSLESAQEETGARTRQTMH